VRVRELNRGSEAEFVRYHEIYSAAEGFERPWAALRSLDDHRVDIHNADPGERFLPLVAEDGGTIVGAAAFYLPLSDNQKFAWLVPWVEPERRGWGVGTALLDSMVGMSRDENRTDLVMEAPCPFDSTPDHPHRRFALKHGFSVANTEVHRLLDLPVPESLLDQLVAESAPHHRDYRIVVFDGPVPDELLPSLCDTKNQLAVDAPTGDLDFEAERETPELHRHREETFRLQGRVRLSTLALAPDNTVAAYSDLVIPKAPDADVLQWGTLVRREHRGRRLGMAVKARNLKELQARIGPERRHVTTANAEQNRWMVGINQRLGFRPVENYLSLLRRL
jgi:GNAT superfamily N-acetyltransferase